MCEKFGFNWENQNHSRMYAFMEIMKAEMKGKSEKPSKDNIINHGNR